MSECVNISNKENETQFTGSVLKTGSKHTKGLKKRTRKKKNETHASLNYIHYKTCSNLQRKTLFSSRKQTGTNTR